MLTMLVSGEEGLLKQLCNPIEQGHSGVHEAGHRLVAVRVGGMIMSIAPSCPTLQAISIIHNGPIWLVHPFCLYLCPFLRQPYWRSLAGKTLSKPSWHLTIKL